jgi:hypothetical protein
LSQTTRKTSHNSVRSAQVRHTGTPKLPDKNTRPRRTKLTPQNRIKSYKLVNHSRKYKSERGRENAKNAKKEREKNAKGRKEKRKNVKSEFRDLSRSPFRVFRVKISPIITPKCVRDYRCVGRRDIRDTRDIKDKD